MASCLSSSLLCSFFCCGLLRYSQPLPFSVQSSFLSRAAITVILSLSQLPLPCTWVRSFLLRFFGFSLEVTRFTPATSHSAFIVRGSPPASPVALPGRLLLTASLCCAFRFFVASLEASCLVLISRLSTALSFSGVFLPLRVSYLRSFTLLFAALFLCLWRLPFALLLPVSPQPTSAFSCLLVLLSLLLCRVNSALLLPFGRSVGCLRFLLGFACWSLLRSCYSGILRGY